MVVKKYNSVFRGLCLTSIAVLVLIIGLALIAEDWKTMIDEGLGTQSSKIISEEIEGEDPLSSYSFQADYDSTDTLIEAHVDLATRMSEEGSVLLKNNSSTLPLQKGAKVTLLGMRGYYSQHGGQIGSSAPEQQNVKLPTALEEAGFIVNKTVSDIYTHYGNIVTGQGSFFGRSFDIFGYRPGTLKNNFRVSNQTPSLSINEPSLKMLSDQNPDYESSFSDYSDAAIVVIGRPSTEAADFFPGATGMEDEGARNILGLTANERDIIQTAKNNFDNVIVVVNSDSAMELNEIENDPDVDAILWVGALGNYGFKGVSNILNGDANPSGHLTDIYSSDSTSSPAMQNFGVITFTNTDEIEPGGTTEYRGNWYLIEAEGIYTGYRYYETRYEDLVTGKGNADSNIGTFDSRGNWKYEDEITYPFGFGLSYTTFSQEIKSVNIAKNKKSASVVVSVTNTGNVPGKDTVQVYAQAPYIEGGVEKSAVQLMNFEKTPTIAPGQSEEITVELDFQYLAAYDYKNSETYILDAGDYYISIGNGSHEALNNILAHKGFSTSDGMDNSGDSSKVFKWTWDKFDDHTFAISKADTPITNQLDDADINYWIPDTVTYLSRSDWAGTWPKKYTDIAATSEMITQLRNDTYVIKKDSNTSAIVWGMESELKLADLKGAEFNDYRWQELLDSVDLEEAIKSIVLAQNIIHGMPSIGSFDVNVNDGPMGFHGTISAKSNENSEYYVSNDDKNANYETRDMPTAVVIGSTFNKDLAYENGVIFGNDSLYNNQSIIWAPGLNTHRTPYNGRNHEYYSEDPILSGKIASRMCQGALTKGLIMSPKHFAFNDQESNRAAVAPFMNEQRAREIELRAFQIAFEEGALGTMTSFTRIGATYANAHVGLMKNILADEWGFRGYIVTDMINGSRYMTLKESLMANVTNFDTSRATLLEEGGDWDYFTPENIKGDYQLQLKMKNALHNSLFAIVNSNAMNGINSTTKVIWQLTSWRAAYIAGIIIFGILSLFFTGLYIVGAINRKKLEVK